jgi:hypothetical protein
MSSSFIKRTSAISMAKKAFEVEALEKAPPLAILDWLMNNENR